MKRSSGADIDYTTPGSYIGTNFRPKSAKRQLMILSHAPPHHTCFSRNMESTTPSLPRRNLRKEGWRCTTETPRHARGDNEGETPCGNAPRLSGAATADGQRRGRSYNN